MQEDTGSVRQVDCYQASTRTVLELASLQYVCCVCLIQLDSDCKAHIQPP